MKLSMVNLSGGQSGQQIPEASLRKDAARMQFAITCSLIIALVIFSVLQASAITSENFNSRRGASTKTLKGFLQKDCWTFRNFDINRDGWNPGIEGDGAMVSSMTADRLDNAGIFTPLLNVDDKISISFRYTFSNPFSGTERRWIKISLADGNNQSLLLLDSFEFQGNADKLNVYNKTFNNNFPGKYRLVLLYSGEGGQTKIGIDELVVSASPAYPGGCNIAPEAKNGRITGTNNRYAAGFLFSNDGDDDSDRLAAYVVKSSPDGNVVVNDDGSFQFAPKKGFAGKSASFTYKICDAGALCSDDATVFISFPDDNKKTEGMSQFLGTYKLKGNVELKWATAFENNLHHFLLERSLNGKDWQQAGEVKALGAPDKGHGYAYMDRVSRNTANRKDMYYRLKQINADGSIAVSRLLVVRVYNTRALTMISVTPDPAKNDIGVNVQLEEASFITMRVVDDNGILAIKKMAYADKGINNFMIDGSSGLSAGSYMLEVIVNSKESMLVKLIKE